MVDSIHTLYDCMHPQLFVTQNVDLERNLVTFVLESEIEVAKSQNMFCRCSLDSTKED